MRIDREALIRRLNAHHAAKRAHGKGMRDSGNIAKVTLLGLFLTTLAKLPGKLNTATKQRKN